MIRNQPSPPLPCQISESENCFRIDKLQKRDAVSFVIHHVGNNEYLFELIIGQLRLYIERSDTFDVISEKIDTVGLVERKRINIENTASYSILSRFIYVIDSLEAIFEKNIRNVRDVCFPVLYQVDRFLR